VTGKGKPAVVQMAATADSAPAPAPAPEPEPSPKKKKKKGKKDKKAEAPAPAPAPAPPEDLQKLLKQQGYNVKKRSGTKHNPGEGNILEKHCGCIISKIPRIWCCKPKLTVQEEAKRKKEKKKAKKAKKKAKKAGESYASD